MFMEFLMAVGATTSCLAQKKKWGTGSQKLIRDVYNDIVDLR